MGLIIANTKVPPLSPCPEARQQGDGRAGQHRLFLGETCLEVISYQTMLVSIEERCDSGPGIKTIFLMTYMTLCRAVKWKMVLILT